MPTKEAIVDSVIPREVEKPIPVRTISTRTGPKINNSYQPNTDRSDQGADSPISAESVKLSPQLSALARKEQAYRQREQVLKQREKDLETKLADAEKYSQIKSKIGSKDYSAAEEELGLNINSYTDYELNKLKDKNPQDEKLSALEAEVQALKKGKEEDAQKQYEDTVAEYKKDISTFIDSNPEFASLKKAGAEGHVLQHILDSWSEDGKELSIDEAAKDIKNFLKEEKKKFDSLFEEQSTEVVAENRSLPPPRVGSKTLTQQMTPGPSEKKPVKSLQFLSESERYAEARRRVLARKENN